MPLYPSADPLNIRPRIVVDPADTERYHLQNLIQAAQLKNLQDEGGFKQQGLDLERAGLGETTRYHSALSDEANKTLAESIRAHKAEELYRDAGLRVTQRGQDLEASGQARGQDITARGQDLAQNAASAQNVNTTQNTLIGQLGQLVAAGHLTPEQYAAAIAEGGPGALAHVLTTSKVEGTAKRVAPILQTIMALAPDGKHNSKVDKYLSALQNPDTHLMTPEQAASTADTWAAVKEHLTPELQKPTEQNQGFSLGDLFTGIKSYDEYKKLHGYSR